MDHQECITMLPPDGPPQHTNTLALPNQLRHSNRLKVTRAPPYHLQRTMGTTPLPWSSRPIPQGHSGLDTYWHRCHLPIPKAITPTLHIRTFAGSSTQELLGIKTVGFITKTLTTRPELTVSIRVRISNPRPASTNTRPSSQLDGLPPSPRTRLRLAHQ